MKALLRQGRGQFGIAAILVCLCVFLSVRPALGAEYFVTKQGNDANNGTERAKAFHTLQRGVDALRPGDTLTIGPGEYFESVKLENFGDLESETLIRAELPGTVLLRGDQDAPALAKMPGRRFAHVADFEGQIFDVIETDTTKTLKLAAGIDAIDISPGSYFYDEAARKLHISTSDFEPADRHHYVVCVRRNHGFLVNNSRRILIDGLAAAGFVEPIENYVFLKANSGFMVIDSQRVTIRHCTAYFNQAGITLHDGDKQTGEGNIVENCRAFGNQTDGIACYYPNNTIFRDCVSFLNGSFGVNFYANRTGNVLFSSNLSWGNAAMDFQMKGSGLSGDEKGALAENCIGLSTFNVFNLSHCIVGGENYYRRGDHARHANPMSPDNIALPIVAPPDIGSTDTDVNGCLRQLDEFKDREFADPINFDFRLQATSQFRKGGEDYAYSGPYPYAPDIYYVAMQGDDQSDGLSMSAAWKTLDHAITKLKAGDTLYIDGGRYSVERPVSLQSVKIRGRGLDMAVIDGMISIANSEGVSVERLQFAGEVNVENSRNISMENCVFAHALEAVKTQGLTLRHAVMVDPLVLRDSSEVHLSGNIFGGSPAVKTDKAESIVYSSYNSYADAAASREVGGKALSLEMLREDQEAEYRAIKPEITVKKGVATVLNAHEFLGRGPLGTSIGLYREWLPLSVRVAGPRVHSVTATTANIEWWTNLPAHVELFWGDTPDCVNSVALDQNDYFSYSLIGLEPGKKYYVKLRPLYAPPTVDPGRRVRLSEQACAEGAFTTDGTPVEARTYYVAVNGRDDRNGLSLETAWQTLQHAADMVRPGDTVLVGGGEYKGTVYFPISGEEGKPITLKAIPGEKTVILGGGFRFYGKHFYNIDSLYFKDFDGQVIVIKYGSNFQITRCHRSGGWSSAINAVRTPNILVKNCAFFPGIGAVRIERCPNTRIENNVLFGTMIAHVRLDNAPDEPFYLVNNIIGESTRGKQHVTSMGMWQIKSMVEANNCFSLRWPENERKLFEIYELSDKERRVSPLFDLHVKEYFMGTLPEYRAIAKPTDSFVANPQLVGAGGTRQGWGPRLTSGDFDSLFTMSPELIKRGIGLQPEAFADFHFKPEKWPYNAMWADEVVAARQAAMDLAEAGKDVEAIDGYTRLAQSPMHDRLKSELLENAAMCANRLKQYDQAIEIARSIPIQALSRTCQMRLMVANGKYGELIDKFSTQSMGGAEPLTSWYYPDLDDLLVEAYGYRAIAYAESGDLKSAEADLKMVIDAQSRIGLSSSVGILEMAWLKLGDFYRRYHKDDARALEAYNEVITRTILNRYNQITPKPVLLGNSETLVLATKAAIEILRNQGRETEAFRLQFSLLFSQGNALALLNRRTEAVDRFTEALAVRGISDAERAECLERINVLEQKTVH